ncbi:DUF305 domain-containing protein [Streptomyces sp. NPDC001595]|uniref:DUF305 domain-containing protein n=1 Tax=Streptomyces sp. NPDC001532 TaxID=3154520 RepID=UPI00332E9BB8
MPAFTRDRRRTHARRLTALAALASGVLLLTACGGSGDDMSGMGHGGGSGSSGATATTGAGTQAFDDADVSFAQQMIPHHEQALDMAKLADGRASDAEIKDIAGKIERAQDPEIRTMKGWLTSWKQPTAAESAAGTGHGGHGGHSGHGGADGMMSDADMTRLKGLEGTAFDKAFAEMMIEHHEGAIAMAEEERKNGRNAEAKKLAAEIVTGQSAEVGQLRAVLDRL